MTPVVKARVRIELDAAIPLEARERFVAGLTSASGVAEFRARVGARLPEVRAEDLARLDLAEQRRFETSFRSGKTKTTIAIILTVSARPERKHVAETIVVEARAILREDVRRLRETPTGAKAP